MFGTRCEGLPQLGECRGTSDSARCPVDPTGQPDRCAFVFEGIDTVDQYGRRATEATGDGGLMAIDDLVVDGDIQTLVSQPGQVIGCGLPVRASFEVLERDFSGHVVNVHLQVRLKVKC